MNTNFREDIPTDLARGAFQGVSMDPDKRGNRAVEDYANTLDADFAELLKHAPTDEKKSILEAEFARYREGYAKRYMAWLHSSSRCMSSFITGPSNFPVARAQKFSRWEHNRSLALMEFRKRALEAIKRTLHPEWRPVMAGDSDAVERLKAKIKKAEEFQVKAKDVNKAIRKNAKAGPEAQIAALVALGFEEERAASWLKPDFAGRIGIPAYELTNNNANIRRMILRLEQIEKNQATASTAAQGENARFEDSPAENRVKLFFPGKPSEEIRTLLKSKGFRWSPTIGAWQAYRNNWSIETAKKLAGLAEVKPTA